MAKINGAPHAKPAFMDAPRCGAHARTTGKACKSPAMPNGRCRMHGGRSTGARTESGKERARMANYKHGERSAETRALTAAMRKLFRGE
jgi:hypothetical protein